MFILNKELLKLTKLIRRLSAATRKLFIISSDIYDIRLINIDLLYIFILNILAIVIKAILYLITLGSSREKALPNLSNIYFAN